jgi:hypothetical protein
MSILSRNIKLGQQAIQCGAAAIQRYLTERNMDPGKDFWPAQLAVAVYAAMRAAEGDTVTVDEPAPAGSEEILELRYRYGGILTILEYRTRQLVIGRKPLAYTTVHTGIAGGSSLPRLEPLIGSDEPMLVPGPWSKWKTVATVNDT